MFDWTYLVFLLAILLSWSMAAVVYLARRTAFQNRVLAIFLVAEGAIIGIGNGALGFEDATARWLVSLVGLACGLAVPGVYLLFLSSLDSPLVTFLRRRLFRSALITLAITLPLTALATPWLYATPSEEAPGVAYGPGIVIVNGVPALLFVYALFVAISAYRRARTDAARKRARAYVTAFAVHDVGLFLILGASVAAPALWGVSLDASVAPLLGVVVCVYIPILAYGILRSQLFDIDLKIKLTLKRSTIVGAFAAAFFVGSQVLEKLIPVNGLLLGVASAAVIALALRPLERGAERLVDRIMPGVSEGPAYLDGRKREVYRAALETAWEDGTLLEKERRLLAHIRATLGMSEDEASLIEREYFASGHGPRGAATPA